jgi:hypothetical protein
MVPAVCWFGGNGGLAIGLGDAGGVVAGEVIVWAGAAARDGTGGAGGGGKSSTVRDDLWYIWK